MRKPRVSVIIPAYNHQRFVAAAIESVLAQTFADFELIVINDGSTDATAEVINSYKDSRLSCFYQQNQDAYNTINRGLHMAKGNFLAILNSDDVYTSTRLERMLAVQQKTDAACLFSDVIPISDEGQKLEDPEFGWNVWHQKNRNFYIQCGDLYTAFIKGNLLVSSSNFFISCDAVKAIGDFCSMRYLHDYDYIFRTMLAFPSQVHYLVEEKLLYYRIHGSNTISKAGIIGRQQNQELVRKYMLAKVPDRQHEIVTAAAQRLVELERELNDLRKVPKEDLCSRIRCRINQLLTAIKNKSV